MAVKKAVKKEEATEKVAKKPAAKKVAEKTVEKKEKKASKKVSGTYFYAVGRRKTSVAQVRLYESEKGGEGEYVINEKKMKDYFPTISLQNVLTAPLKAVGVSANVKMTVVVRGGGFTGQAEAIRLGIARALVKMNEDFKKTVKDQGFLTRNSREVERKKPGLKGARRAPQWAKR